MDRPADWIREATDRWGLEEVARRCAAQLTGGPDDLELLGYLTGDGEDYQARRGEWASHQVNRYWLRVWAARGLLHAWSDEATPALITALSDEHWRVREMACKVTARWEVGPAAEAVVPLLADDVPRVRAAAARAMAVVGEAEHVDALSDLRDDPEAAVRTQADRALSTLGRRIDREV